MTRPRRAVVLAAAAALVAAVAGIVAAVSERSSAGAPRPGHGASWSPVVVPQPGGMNSDLTAVASSGAGSAWAVGYAGPVNQDGHTGRLPAALRYEDRSWRAVPLPAPAAGEVEEAVADGGPGDAWMIGSAGLRRWDGTAWRRFPLRGLADQPGTRNGPSICDPPGGARIAAADGASWVITCGEYDRLGDGILSWNGRSWKFTAERGDLLSAVAASGPDDVWAVGGRSGGPGSVALHWDGRSWADRSPPVSAFPNLALSQVAVAGPRDLWAAGADQSRLRFARSLLAVAVHYDGRSWTETPLPAQTPPDLGDSPGSLFAVALDRSHRPWISAASDRADRPMYFHWDGHAWMTLYGTPRPLAIQVDATGIAMLNGGRTLLSVGGAVTYRGPLSAVSETRGTEGGLAALGAVPTRITPAPLAPAEGPAGGIPLPAGRVTSAPGWSVTPVPPLRPQASLDAVTALDGQHVWAGGQEYAGFVAPGVPLVLRYDGARWHRFSGAGLSWPGRLTSIAATGPDDIWATGADTAGRVHLVHWDGASRSWADVPFPGQRTPDLSVQIAAARGVQPWLIGSYVLGDGFSEGFVERWTGQQWRTVPLPPSARGGPPAVPAAIEVIGVDDVWLGASWLFGPSELAHWDGSSWAQDLNPDFEITGILAAGPHDVWAVGSPFPVPHVGTCCASDLPPPPYPGIGHWNGTAWSLFQVPGTLAPTSITLNGAGQPAWVSACPSAARPCRPLYLRYDGRTFRVAPGPPADGPIALTGIPGTGQAVAVGQADERSEAGRGLQTFGPLIEFSDTGP